MHFWILLSLLLAAPVGAGEFGDLRLIQAQAELPAIDLWLDMPSGTVVRPEQFAITVGAQAAAINTVESFAQTGDGVAYIFLVDISKSLSTVQFAQIKQALKHWLGGMGETDRAALITFGREVKQRLAFTDDQDKLNNAIDALSATDMETSLYRGLVEAINLGRHLDNGLPARRAIVILSDGIDDTLNGVTVDEVFKHSQEYRVPIYSIGFAAPPLNDDKRQGLKVLGMLSRQSGGHFVQAEAAHLDAAYEQQLQHIMQAYHLRVACAACTADGQSYRLNLTWSDGQRSLNDGLDIRLLPKMTAEAKAKSDRETPVPDMPGLVFGGSLLLFLTLLVLIYRQRLAKKPDAESMFTRMEAAAKQDKTKDMKAVNGGVGVQLTVVAGVQKGQIFRLRIADSAVIGRAAGCDLAIADDVEISSQHAVLKNSGGKLTVRDLHSTNGTLINGVPIHNEYPLRNGDLLLLGRTEMRIEQNGSN